MADFLGMFTNFSTPLLAVNSIISILMMILNIVGFVIAIIKRDYDYIGYTIMISFDVYAIYLSIIILFNLI